MRRLDELYNAPARKSLWSRAKEGLERVKERHDSGFKKLQMKQEFDPRSAPNLGQKDAKEPNFSMGKAALGAVVGTLAAGPIGGASLGVLWGMKKKK